MVGNNSVSSISSGFFSNIAVGFAMLLRVMLKFEFIPYLLIGFVIACFLDYSNLLPIAIVGVALALLVYNIEEKIGAAKTVAEEDFEDGI